jgi:hypothetical protein
MIDYARPVALTPFLIFAFSAMLTAAGLIPSNVTVGQNLETETKVTLDAAAPSEGLVISVTTNDPSRVLLSKTLDAAGSESITVTVRGGGTASQEFYIQGLADTGSVTYTVSASGYGMSSGTVTLRPSGIVIAGPAKFGNPLVTTPKAWRSNLNVYSAQLDSSRQFAAVQLVRGGLSVTVHLTSSDPRVGAAVTSPLEIAGGSFNATTQFQPANAGSTILAVDVPPGFSIPAQYTTVTADVNLPGIAVTDPMPLGENLQVGGVFLLGEPAPPGGLPVTLTSNSPSQLLVSASATETGSKTITVTVPEGGKSGSYFLQGLANTGTVTYYASAPGYRGREGIITLTPSGVFIIGPLGPPDEAEALRPEAPVGPHGFFASLSAGKHVSVVVCTAFLEPKKHRGADITLQPLRAGLSLTVELKNSNPAVGTMGSSATITGGSGVDGTEFVPLSVGETVLSVITPKGFTTPSNATSLEVIVKP